MVTNKGQKEVDLAYRPHLADLKRVPPRYPASESALERSTVLLEAAGRPRISPPEKFAGRTGYAADFLEGFRVDFPEPTGAQASDVTPVGRDRHGRLHYHHFSIVMSASRRTAMFTAVNIAGARSVKVARDDDKWFLDGRIPVEAQIGESLYSGNRLDRGHLVRREDPNWGDDAEAANEDTFHFTNCAPQMDVVNQRTWLGLEEYILQNARAWKESCSVFTGPVCSEQDTRYRDVSIPKAFWKVVAFITDDMKPSATAYVVEQDKELSGLEAAFGAYKTYQRSVKHIEEISGISFGTLADYDGFSNEENAQGGVTISSRIKTLSDIRV